MPNYKITISKTAQKQLDKLSYAIADPIFEAILNLSRDPRPLGCKKLRGREAFRVRKGKFRIIYEVFDNIVTINVVVVGHRSDVYR